MSYPGPETEHGKKRMAEDGAMIGDPELWPQYSVLHLKEQPWCKANGRRYGLIARQDVLERKWRVWDKDSHEAEIFKSLDDLVQTWSVD